MSRRPRKSVAVKQSAHASVSPPATVFAALGDPTRLSLVGKVCGGEPRSISELTKGSRRSRQAVTKHLRVLERARIVHSVRVGRESLFAFDPAPMDELRKYLDRVSEQWDQALA